LYQSDLLLRSMMFVPGHNEKLLISASKSQADALILDIEDSVPANNKAVARNTIGANLSHFKNFSIFIRINDIESGHCIKDVTALTLPLVTGFVYPKATTGKDIYFFSRLLEALEYEKGFPIGTFKIVPLIETASAVLNAQEICLTSNRVIAIAYGCEDFIADLHGITLDQSLYVPKTLIALAARATGVIPIDTVHTNIHDLVELESNARLARVLGFEGMLILHPKEIEVAHKCFTPTESEIAEAKEILHLSDEAVKSGKGVAILDGKFIGPPMVLQAKNVLDMERKVNARVKETTDNRR